MATATAAPAAGAPAAKGGKKKLLIIIGGVVLLLAIAGGVAAVLVMKNKAAAAAAAEDDEYADKPRLKPAPLIDPKTAPAFLPLDPFTVNLADRNADRYAQVTITLQLSDPKQADVFKAFMPAVRNNVLMLLSQKSAEELLQPDGKTQLAQQIRKEASRALGIEVDEEPEGSKRRRAPVALPVSAVHFSTFIIQ